MAAFCALRVRLFFSTFFVDFRFEPILNVSPHLFVFNAHGPKKSVFHSYSSSFFFFTRFFFVHFCN